MERITWIIIGYATLTPTLVSKFIRTLTHKSRASCSLILVAILVELVSPTVCTCYAADLIAFSTPVSREKSSPALWYTRQRVVAAEGD